MRLIINGIGKAALFGVLAFGLSACGGGGGGDDDEGGFTASAPLKVTLSAHRTLLPQNSSFIAFPNPGDPYTTILTVRAEINGKPADGLPVQLAVSRGLELGSLVCPEVSETCTEFNQPPEPAGVADFQKRWRSIGGEEFNATITGGVFTFYFVSEGGANGVATVTATIRDPSTNQSVAANVDIRIGAGVSTGQAAQIRFQISPAPLYITGQGQEDVRTFQVFVLDDAGGGVPNPAGNNLRLQLLAGRPNGGEKLVSRDAAGNTQEGTIVNAATVNGVAQVALHAGSLPGTVRIAAVSDRSDNNVDNGIQASVSDVENIAIGSGEVVSLTFTGPYPGAVAAQANNLGLGTGDSASNGVYTRLISVIAADEFGNPPAPGKPITFNLIDSPATGYPTQGRGTFTLSGSDGNPQEGGNTFTAQTSSLAGARVNCLLVLEGQRPYQEGGRLISGVAGVNLLSVYNPFNQTTDTGFTVPYTVGCPPHFGNVENAPGITTTVQTDASGVASTLINYPITQLGRNFKLVAEANGGKAGAVLSHWYLGVPDGSELRIIPPEDADFTVPIGALGSKTLTLQLLDGVGSPLIAETLTAQIVITDPDEVDAALAEADAAAAEAALAAIDDPGDCDEDEPADQATCDLIADLRDAANQARIDAAAARTRADLYAPKACVTSKLTVTSVGDAECAKEPVLITGADGLVQAKLLVDDLPPNGQVEFFFSSIGPEILADTLTVTATPPAAASQ